MSKKHISGYRCGKESWNKYTIVSRDWDSDSGVDEILYGGRNTVSYGNGSVWRRPARLLDQPKDDDN